MARENDKRSKMPCFDFIFSTSQNLMSKVPPDETEEFKRGYEWALLCVIDSLNEL